VKTDDYDNAAFYDCRDSERLTCTDPDEAIEEWLAELDEGDEPETITVCAYKRSVIDQAHGEEAAAQALNAALQYLDETYGDPEDYMEVDKATRVKMGESAARFLAELIPLIEVYRCDPCGRREINVAEWKKDREG
jgi:hypothetical protein